jgi:hypothetical protein
MESAMSDDFRRMSPRGKGAQRRGGESAIAISIAVAIGIVVLAVLTLARVHPPDDPAGAVTERLTATESATPTQTPAPETTGQAPESSSDADGR